MVTFPGWSVSFVPRQGHFTAVRALRRVSQPLFPCAFVRFSSYLINLLLCSSLASIFALNCRVPQPPLAPATFSRTSLACKDRPAIISRSKNLDSPPTPLPLPGLCHFFYAESLAAELANPPHQHLCRFCPPLGFVCLPRVWFIFLAKATRNGSLRRLFYSWLEAYGPLTRYSFFLLIL